ncbi:MAG: hypothetical protein RJA34_3218 [Pseudomonadota bacterium]
MGPGLNPRYQMLAADLNLVDRHRPIVKTVLLPTEAATQALAEHLAAQADIQNAYIELHGNLGAGKTTLVRHLLRALGVQGRIKSPTYAVVEPYELTDRQPVLKVWHFDFYRFNDPREWEDAGFRDIFANAGLKLAEWPQQAAGVLPVADLVLRLSVIDEDARSLELCAQTPTGAKLLADLPPLDTATSTVSAEA